MTNFQKIKSYYQHFNEWNRLDTPPGQLELKLVLKLIEEHILAGSDIFDLGGGPGRYSYELALKGYRMYLGDLSPDLIAIAREKLSNFEGKENIKRIEIVNATDLAHVKDETYENVMLFGPLYHLTEMSEIHQCLQGVHRILKPNGKIIASYLPYHGGLISILERTFHSPQQVSSSSFSKVFKEGVFQNQCDTGFQEGKFIQSKNLLTTFSNLGFRKILVRSIRGIGYQKEEEILQLQHKNSTFFREIMNVINLTASDEPILETCGHAIYIGEKS